MPDTLLVLTNREDFTADFMIAYLQERGRKVFRLDSDFAHEYEFVYRASDGGVEGCIRLDGREVRSNSIRSIWYRRAIRPFAHPHVEPELATFAEAETRHAIHGWLLSGNIRWISPIANVAQAERKLYQLAAATEIGFRVPSTLVSTDVDELKHFRERWGDRGTICKPISHGLLATGSGLFSIHTHKFPEPSSLLPDEGRVCPTLIQERIPRLGDIRLTCVVDQFFCVRIVSNTGVPMLDWRQHHGNLTYEILQAPLHVETMCLQLLQRLGLSFGAFDFVETPDGEWVFLEVNPVGEWAWLENELGLPIREAFETAFYK